MFVTPAVADFAVNHLGTKRQVAVKQHSVSTSASLNVNADLLCFHAHIVAGC